MKTNKTNNNATVNNNNIKEEAIMTKTERIMDTYRRVQEFTKTSDEGYVKKDELIQLFDDCMGNRPSKKTTRKELVESLETIVNNIKSEQNKVPVGDMSSDKYYPELQNDDNAIVIDKKHGDYLIKNIVKASFIATKGDNKGNRIITMHKLFGIIKNAYSADNKPVDEAFIKDIINQLVILKYICFKKYESGAIVFYPTVKAKEYINNNK